MFFCDVHSIIFLTYLFSSLIRNKPLEFEHLTGTFLNESFHKRCAICNMSRRRDFEEEDEEMRL